MNYQKIYNNLINKARNRILNGYSEEHHIIPKCFFKSEGGHLDGNMNEKSNLILLTAEEHYLAHQLLIKIYPNNDALIFAANMMCVDAHGVRTNNKRYGWIKRRLAAIVGPRMKKLHTGKKQSEEHIRKRTAHRKGMKANNKKKPIYCVEEGILFIDGRDATRFAGLKSFYDVHDVALGRKNYAGNYTWRYLDENGQIIEPIMKTKRRRKPKPKI